MNKVDRFNNMDFNDKMRFVWNKATFLLSKASPHKKSNLYFNEGYFIELHYDRRECRIYDVKATDSREIVDSYVEEVDITSFF